MAYQVIQVFKYRIVWASPERWGKKTLHCSNSESSWQLFPNPPLLPSWHMWAWMGEDSVNGPSFLSWCYNAVNCVYGWQTDVFTEAYKGGQRWPPDRNKHKAAQLKVQYNGADLRWLAFLNSHNPFCRLRSCPAEKTHCGGVELVGVIYIAKGT